MKLEKSSIKCICQFVDIQPNTNIITDNELVVSYWNQYDVNNIKKFKVTSEDELLIQLDLRNIGYNDMALITFHHTPHIYNNDIRMYGSYLYSELRDSIMNNEFKLARREY